MGSPMAPSALTLNDTECQRQCHLHYRLLHYRQISELHYRSLFCYIIGRFCYITS